jgi:hypothetical protein
MAIPQADESTPRLARSSQRDPQNTQVTGTSKVATIETNSVAPSNNNNRNSAAPSNNDNSTEPADQWEPESDGERETERSGHKAVPGSLPYILHNARSGRFIELQEDVWGCAIYTIVRDFPHILLLTSSFEGAVRFFYIMGILGLNLSLQLGMLYWVAIYVLLPSVRETQEYYELFHQDCFDAGGKFSHDKFHQFEHREVLCQIPLYDSMFIWSVLFLWSSTCFLEIRNTERIFRSILALPDLPETAKPEDMVTEPGQLFLDVPEEADNWALAEFKERLHDMRSTDKLQPELEQICEGVQRMLTHMEGQVGGNEQTHVTCLSAPTRMALLALVLVPRAGIILILMTLGCTWLLATTKFENLILNALALEFVISIDNLLFSMYFPQALRGHITEFIIAPPGEVKREKQNTHHQMGADTTDADITEQIASNLVGTFVSAHEPSKGKSDVDGYVRSMMYICAIILWVILFLRICPVLPGYSYDINMACMSYIQQEHTTKIETNKYMGCIMGYDQCFPFGLDVR